MWTDAMPLAGQFKKNCRETFERLSSVGRRIKVPKNLCLYTAGDNDPNIYLIESGQIKLSVPSPEGKECLMAIRITGDIFGELSLTGQTIRFETAVAMKDAVVKQVFYRDCLMHLKRESLLESLVRYLAGRMAEQQELITSLTTMNSELRLARILLHLSGILGQNQDCGTCITQKISQSELAKMVGTTRTRIGVFLKKFRDQGLLHMTMDGCLVLEEDRIGAYILGSDSSSVLRDASPRKTDSSGPLAKSAHRCGNCLPTKIRL